MMKRILQKRSQKTVFFVFFFSFPSLSLEEREGNKITFLMDFFPTQSTLLVMFHVQYVCEYSCEHKCSW